MADYEFYVETYGGDSLSLDDFQRLIKRAEAKLSRYERIYTVSGTDEARNMALCAMTDALYYFETAENGGLTQSSSVGSVSSSFSAPQMDLSPKAQNRELYRCACEYLRIFRGCG